LLVVINKNDFNVFLSFIFSNPGYRSSAQNHPAEEHAGGLEGLAKRVLRDQAHLRRNPSLQDGAIRLL
jgi:hypothetical protein